MNWKATRIKGPGKSRSSTYDLDPTPNESIPSAGWLEMYARMGVSTAVEPEGGQ